MVGGNRRRGALSEGGRTPERWAWSPAPSSSSASASASASQPLSGEMASSARRRGGASPVASLFRAIAQWLGAFSGQSMRKKKKPSAGEEDARRKPPLRGLHSRLYRHSPAVQFQSLQFQSSVFSMEEILKATSNFSPALKIGQGGFGTVYKGTLPDGTLVAVKRAKQRMHNPHVDVEFESEIKMMASVEHQNLVRFYGYMECGEERIVVVEYVPNGTLREHLDRLNGKFLDFGARLDIAIDVAHAVTYLHMYSDRPIIHRDIKSSNILLTHSLRAKVADFGFARHGASESGVTHVSTQVKGTAGYLDPEYLQTYQLTDRSDVYSFGILLVELLSARRPLELKRDMKERVTAKWAMKKFIEGRSADVLDPYLARNAATEEAVRQVLELSFRCQGPVRPERPSMKDCCRALWQIRKSYKEAVSAAAAASATPLSGHGASSSSGDRSGEMWKL